MKKARPNLFKALFLLVWGAGFLAGRIYIIRHGGFSQGHFGMTTGPDIHRGSNPSKFWGTVTLQFVLAAIGFWAGALELRSYLRGRKA
jgi:hypothetical protein